MVSGRINFTKDKDYNKFNKRLEQLDKQFANYYAAFVVDASMDNVTFGEFVDEGYYKKVLFLRGVEEFKRERDLKNFALYANISEFLSFDPDKVYKGELLTLIQEFVNQLYSLKAVEIIYLTWNIISHKLNIIEALDLESKGWINNSYPTFLNELSMDLFTGDEHSINVNDYCELLLKFTIDYTNDDFVPNIISDCVGVDHPELYLLREVSVYECAHSEGIDFTLQLFNSIKDGLRDTVKEFLHENGLGGDEEDYKNFLLNNLKTLNLNKDIISYILNKDSELPVEWKIELFTNLFSDDFKKQLYKKGHLV